MALTDKLSAIGSAIREKTGKTELLSLDAMPTEIRAIQTGSGGNTAIINSILDGSVKTINDSDLTGIVSLRDYVFYYHPELESITLPDTLQLIGTAAFEHCEKLTTVNAFGVVSIFAYAFYNCSELSYIDLPVSLWLIGNDAFSNSGLTEVTIPANVFTVGDSAFAWCNNLTTVTFKGTPNDIGSGCFSFSNSLTDIYVPWSEGAVANAPWGADNATIHYNSEV